MIKEAIGIGETEVEAQENACKQLGVETYEAEFEILQRAEKKVLGLFGGCPAKVRAFIKASPADCAADYLRNVLDAMSLGNITIETKENDEGAVLDLEGADVGYIIGRRGETLDALQYLTSLVANRTESSYFRITLNTGDYREKREKTLEILGRKLAFKAVKTGYKTKLEPMNPYERRIIHTAVQKVNGATSWSEGENLARHVIIGPDPNAPRPSYNRRDGQGYNKGGYGDRRPPRRDYGDKRPSRPYNNAGSGATRTEDKNRTPINEGGTGGLYGRIDK